MNALNRSLEGIIEVCPLNLPKMQQYLTTRAFAWDRNCLLNRPGQIGNEFASVEALWSQFETVMGRGNEGGLDDGSGSVEGQGGKEHDGEKQAS